MARLCGLLSSVLVLLTLLLGPGSCPTAQTTTAKTTPAPVMSTNGSTTTPTTTATPSSTGAVVTSLPWTLLACFLVLMTGLMTSR